VLAAADGTLLAAHGEAIGVAGANVAEYRALVAGLVHAGGLGLDRVDARCGAGLVVEQVTGGREPANPRLRELCIAVREAAQRIGTVVFAWVPAEADGRAHALVAKALAISTATGDTAERRRDDRTKGRTAKRRTRGEPVTAA
jgi:ribonuclease H / adenosylcobalamin/alpha-ribazole phosphatase